MLLLTETFSQFCSILCESERESCKFIIKSGMILVKLAFSARILSAKNYTTIVYFFRDFDIYVG